MFGALRGSSGKLFDVLAPGLYAWGLTVGWPVSQRFAPLVSRIFALVALVSLVSGAALVLTSPKLARTFGIWVFLGACIGTWASFAPAFGPLQLDPVQGILGSIGWALFAISWGGDRATANATPTASASGRTSDKGDRRRPPLPRMATFVLALVAAAAATPMLLAFWVQSVERALLAHAVALAAAIALVTFAADLFEPRSRAEEAGFDLARKADKRIAAALPAFLALTTLIVIGAVYTLLR
jgi:hypothetical protein